MNATRIPENAEKGLQAIPAVRRSHDASSKSAFSRSRCTGSTSIRQLKFDWERSSGATGQATVLQFSAFRDHSLWHFAVHPSWTHVLITELAQMSHTDVTCGRTIRPSAYGLHQRIPTHQLGHHTLGIECKGVLSTGVDRMLVRNRVGVHGLTRSVISSFAPI